MLITFRNAQWIGVFHSPGTPICIAADRIKAVTVEEQYVVVNVDVGKDATILKITCESHEGALRQQGLIVDAVNGESLKAVDTLSEWNRIKEDNQRSPRLITVEKCHDGQFSFGEVGKDSEQYDTTVTGEVLQAIEEYVVRTRCCGTVTVQGIKYHVAYLLKED